MKKPRHLLALISIIPLLLFCSLTVAADEAGAKAPSAAAPSALEVLAQKKGWKVISTFKTDAPALTGYVLKNSKGNTAIIYSVGDIIVVGTLLDANGDNLSEKYDAQYLPKPDYEKVAKALEDDKTLIVEGREGARVPIARACGSLSGMSPGRLSALQAKVISEGVDGILQPPIQPDPRRVSVYGRR